MIKFTVKEQDAVQYASNILLSKIKQQPVFTSPNMVKDFLKFQMVKHDREVFSVLFLDSQHNLIEFEDLFFGTIDSASVYPREILKRALHHNASAVILSHNHPSGNPTASLADKKITNRIIEGLKIIDIRVLDHFIVGLNDVYSFAENGLI